MEYVEAFLKFIETYGVNNAITFSLLLILGYSLRLNSSNSKRTISALDQVSATMVLVSQKIETPYLGIEESLTLFRAFADNLVFDLLREIEEVIEKNSFAERKPQIKKNLSAQFKNILIEKSEILSRYNSKAGDLGKILNDGLGLEKMMVEVFTALFTKHKDKDKVRDIKSILAERLNSIITEIERRPLAN